MAKPNTGGILYNKANRQNIPTDPKIKADEEDNKGENLSDLGFHDDSVDMPKA